MCDSKAGMIQEEKQMSESEILSGYMSMITYKQILHIQEMSVHQMPHLFAMCSFQVRHLGLPCGSSQVSVCTKAVTVPLTSGHNVCFSNRLDIYFKHFTSYK